MEPTPRRARAKAVLRAFLTYAVIVAVTLIVLDVALRASGLFPPRYDPGNPTLGWVAATPTGESRPFRCPDPSSGEMVTFLRNEDGYRTERSAADHSARENLLVIAETGDSHSDLCAPNESTHFGFMEARLEERGRPSAAFSYAAGRYSPLQAYLAIEPAIARYSVDVLVLNLYTGNDFYDMMRVDDRPYFVPDGDAYRIAEPIWYQYDPPDARPRSRVAYGLRSIAEAIGVRNVLLRLRYLRAAAAEQNQGFFTVIRYVNDLRRATAPEVGYAGAFAAQMLNQQLFFYRFPGSRAESVRRVRAVLELARSQHPDVVLVLSPIPSYQLVGEQPVAPEFIRTLDRLPITYGSGMQEEGDLYHGLATLAEETGWLFVDNLGPLRAYRGPAPLFNDFDYHITPIASEIIGTAQAEAIDAAFR